jgi:hypothetical protein
MYIDVHRQMAETRHDQLDGAGLLGVRLAQPVREGRQDVAIQHIDVGPVLQQDRVGGQLVEVAALATADHGCLVALLDPGPERRGIDQQGVCHQRHDIQR